MRRTTDRSRTQAPKMRRQRGTSSYWQLMLVLNFWWGKNHQLLVAYGTDEVKVQTTVLCGLSNIIYPGGHVTRLSSKMSIHWKLSDNENDSLQMAFQYIGGQAWVGVGFSSTNQGNMLGSRAVVGVPGNDASSNSTVQVYQLMAKQPQDASAIVQNPDFAASHKVEGHVEMKSYETILHFSLDGLSDFQRPDDEHLYTFIYAVGQSTTLGMHAHQGAFRLNLQFCGGHVPSPTKPSPAITSAPAPQPHASETSPAPAVDPAEGTPSGTDESPQSPEPSRSPIQLQDSVQQNPSNSSSADSGTASSSATSYDHKTAFAAHGFLATIAFAVLVPTAMASAWFRSLMPQWWIYVHVLSNCTGFFFAVLSVIVAFSGVVLRGTTNGGPVSHLSLTHHRTGLFLLLMAAAQVVSGFCRPPVQPSDDRNDDDDDDSESDVHNRICGWTTRIPWWGDLSRREKWHWLHRGVAVTIIGLATYQLTSGASLYSQEYQGGQTTTVVAMWVWLACVAASFICLRLYLLTRAGGSGSSDASGTKLDVARRSSVQRTISTNGLRGFASASPAAAAASNGSSSVSGGPTGGVWRSPPPRAFSSHRLERNMNLLPHRDKDTSMRDEDDDYEFEDFEPLEPRHAELKSFTNVI